MKWTRTPAIGLAAGMAILLVDADWAAAQIFHHQRARVRCCLPPGRYADDHDRTRDSLLGVVPADMQTGDAVTWLEDGVPRPSIQLGYGVAWGVHRKKPDFASKSLTAGLVKLDQIAAAVYDTGRIACTGKISHTGPADGDSLGKNVTIRVRAYAGPTGQNPQLLNAPMVWESRADLWIRRADTRVVSLVPKQSHPSSELRRYFQEITHVEVELQSNEDR